MISSLRRLTWCLPFLVLVSCASENKPSEPPTTGGAQASANAALFDPTTSTIPLPNILATATADDPIEGRAANTPMTPPEALAYINLHEMGGTSAVAGLNAPIYLRFSYALDPATVTPANIKVFQVIPDAAGTEDDPLGFTDISGLYTYQYAAGSTDVFLFPNFPLTPGTRYLYVVTNRVKDAASNAPLISSVYFSALKATAPLTGNLAPLEPIRANKMESTHVLLSGYAKVMDNLITPAEGSDDTTISSRNDIVLMGRFITTGAGFIPQDATSDATIAASRIPVETALRAFAAGAMAKTWSNAITVDTTFDLGGTNPTPSAFWTVVMGTSTAAPPTVNAVVLGKINSAQLSVDPVIVGTHATTMDLSGVSGAYNPAAGVVQAFRSGATLAGFYHSTADANGGQVPFVYIAPAGTAPSGGWPLVIFQHGITSQKETVIALAQTLTAYGFALVAIDLPLHNALAVPDHTTGEQWGNDFMALGAPLATRSNFQQAAFNLNRLEITVRYGGFATLGADAPSMANIHFVGHSLGSMVGAYYLAGNTTLATSGYPYTQTTLDGDMKGFLSVPGARTAYLIANSPAFGPGVIAGLNAAGIPQGTPTFHQFFQVTQSVIDTVDPATMTTPLAAGLPSRLSGRIVIQEATSSTFAADGSPTNGDLVISNPYARYFGNALGGRGILGVAGAAVAPNFMQLGYLGSTSPRIPAPFMFTLDGTTPEPKVDFAAALSATAGPGEGYFQFDQAGIGHGFLLDPSNVTNITLGQTQLLYYLMGGLVVDPSAAVAPLIVSAPQPVIHASKRYTIFGHR